MVEVSMIW